VVSPRRRDTASAKRTGAFEGNYPQLAPLLATPCDFVIYRKPLTVGTSA
jgi:hypothetical protein